MRLLRPFTFLTTNSSSQALRGQLRGCRSEEHTSELQSRPHLVCRLLLEKKKIPTDIRLLLDIVIVNRFIILDLDRRVEAFHRYDSALFSNLTPDGTHNITQPRTVPRSS